MLTNFPFGFIVSVECNTYNQSDYIEDAMNGFCMQQTAFPFVCFILDDASTDGEPDVISRYMELHFLLEGNEYYTEDNDDYHLVIARHRQNTNCYFACFYLKHNHYSFKKNKKTYLKRWTEVKYIALCEGDDYWTNPKKLQTQVEYLDGHNDCYIAFNYVNVVDSNGLWLDKTIPPSSIYKEIITLSDLIDLEFKRGIWTFHTSSIVFRKEIEETFLKLTSTIFRTIHCGDLPLELTCLLRGNGYLFPEICGCYRSGVGIFSANRTHFDNVIFQIEIIDSFLNFDAYTKYKYSKAINTRIKGMYNYMLQDLMHDTTFYNSKYFLHIMKCDNRWNILVHFVRLRYITYYISSVRIIGGKMISKI